MNILHKATQSSFIKFIDLPSWFVLNWSVQRGQQIFSGAQSPPPRLFFFFLFLFHPLFPQYFNKPTNQKYQTSCRPPVPACPYSGKSLTSAAWSRCSFQPQWPSRSHQCACARWPPPWRSGWKNTPYHTLRLDLSMGCGGGGGSQHDSLNEKSH